MEKRKDNKGRNLRENERQRSDGCYEYRYIDPAGKKISVYSWRLVSTDRTPPGKKDKPALRDQVREILKALLDGTMPTGGSMTVIQLCERYLMTKTGVSVNTEANYKTVMNTLKKEPFGQLPIHTIHTSDAKLFLLKLQKEDGKGSSTIHSIRGVLRPAFRMAVEDDILLKNPFDWELYTVIVNDSHTRDAISRADERRFLEFVRQDSHFSQYYDGLFLLFRTGLRISELCGLTLADLDFKGREIRIDHQLQRSPDSTLYIKDTKTNAGTRTIPMSDEVYACLKRIVNTRKTPKAEPFVDRYTGFLFLNYNARKGLRPMVAMDWQHICKRITTKYNDIYKNPLPKITPHVCRHTYCSNMAKSGMNPKVLQYLMGHSDISVIMNTYTHLGLEAAKDELQRLDTQTKTGQW